jgi:hypothetical protein
MDCNAEFYVINITPIVEHLAEFHTGEELIGEQREHFWSLLYDDFPELLQPLFSLRVSRQWEHPIETSGPVKRQRLNKLPNAEHVELNR